MDKRADNEVVVGEIVRPHGVKGELVVRSYADSPDLFRAGRVLRLIPPSGKGPALRRTVVSRRVHADRLLVVLSGVADRDAAEALRGVRLAVAAGDLPALAEGEVYRHQLIGCRVVAPDLAQPDLGILEDIADLPGQEVWTIRHASGREILLPANPHTIADIDPSAGLITATPPPGLVELYLDGPDPSAAGKGAS